MVIARAYGMIANHAPDSSLVRAAFVIDPKSVVRAISWYPMTTGRSVTELLRLVCALRTTDMLSVSTPEGWQPGEEVLCRRQPTLWIYSAKWDRGQIGTIARFDLRK